MSTNKTTNYALHAWVPDDDFLRSEFNENFSAIDAALAAETAQRADADAQKAELVLGTYTGDGEESQFISLGFTPKAVLVISSQGAVNHYGGLAMPGFTPAISGHKIVSVESGGFRVYYAMWAGNGTYSNTINTNDEGATLAYVALK